MLVQVGIGLQFLMQKIKTKISKASIYQFENFFHLSSFNESLIKVGYKSLQNFGLLRDLFIKQAMGRLNLVG